MKIAFLGNSLFLKPEIIEKKLLECLNSNVGDNSAEALLGGNTNFDFFVKEVCEIYKASHPNFSFYSSDDNIKNADLVITFFKYDTEEAIDKLNAVKKLNKKLIAI